MLSSPIRRHNYENDTMQCLVCSKQEAKYTCPKCKVQYCSVGCYKSHQVTCKKKEEEEEEDTRPAHDKVTGILEEERMKEFLRSKTLKYHILRIAHLADAAQGSSEERQNRALEAIADLRLQGKDENEEFEGFAQCILDLTQPQSVKSMS
jgi:hypothetical protein